MFILDTNVVSELRKVRMGKASEPVAQWADSVDICELYVSAITVHELEIGVLRLVRRDPEQGALLRSWLDQQVLPTFDGRVLPVDGAVALRGAQLHVPDAQPLFDGLIAATALVHDMTVVTRDASDFLPCGVKVFNPWQSGGAVSWPPTQKRPTR